MILTYSPYSDTDNVTNTTQVDIDPTWGYSILTFSYQFALDETIGDIDYQWDEGTQFSDECLITTEYWESILPLFQVGDDMIDYLGKLRLQIVGYIEDKECLVCKQVGINWAIRLGSGGVTVEAVSDDAQFDAMLEAQDDWFPVVFMGDNGKLGAMKAVQALNNWYGHITNNSGINKNSEEIE